MKKLYLLRHAKAASALEGGADRERPLTERGQRAARAVARWMAEKGLEPELILCSSAVRTRQTLALILPACARARQVLYEDGLYLAEARALLARLRRVPAASASVMLVGHNPGLEELATHLAGGSRRLAPGLPTGALVIFDLSSDWDELEKEGTRLVELVTPKELSRERD